MTSGGKIPKVAVRNMHILILSGDKMRLSTAIVIMGRLCIVHFQRTRSIFVTMCVCVRRARRGNQQSTTTTVILSPFLMAWDGDDDDDGGDDVCRR